MRTVCVKVGGSTVDAEGLLSELGKSVNLLSGTVFSLIVHGGGKDIARQLDLLNKEFTFIEGMRVTDAEMVKVVQMVLSGDVNKRIVNAFLKENVKAIGISGVDGNLFKASKMMLKGKDIGFVGKIESVSTEFITLCRQAGFTPVISPVSRDDNGTIYNVNADLAASEMAMALEVDDLIFISDVPGVLIDDAVVKEIKTSEIEDLITKGHITGGMIPKLRSASEAVHRRVKRVHICGWYGPDTLKNQLSDSHSGTIISK